MDVIGCSSRMTSEDACASEDARASMNGMLLCSPGVCSRHGISHGSRVKDSVLRCHRKRFSVLRCSKRLLVRASSMNPLAVLEAQLGIVDILPSYVLREMFQ